MRSTLSAVRKSLRSNDGRLGAPQRLPDAMSVREHYEASCGGKARFESPALAHAALRRAKSKRSYSRRRCRMTDARTMYRCKFCGGWHLGNGPGQA